MLAGAAISFLSVNRRLGKAKVNDFTYDKRKRSNCR